MGQRKCAMENLDLTDMRLSDFWRGKRVFVTGHTGFKGSWLTIWLEMLGAVVTGYALDPPTRPSLFELASVKTLAKSHHADILDYRRLEAEMKRVKPDIVFHLAAQALVQESYRNPLDTFKTNCQGTVHILEAVRQCSSVGSVVIVTSDKCYANKEWVWGYREVDELGGKDPYSASKACAELITSAYHNAYFSSRSFRSRPLGLATARSGNVIGGGDWSENRLIPDCIKAFIENRKVGLRRPACTRPWQHVLDPLAGYLVVAQRLFESGEEVSGAYNFGPPVDGQKTVEWVVKTFCRMWGPIALYSIENTDLFPESVSLNLDCTKAATKLGWAPIWGIETAIEKTIIWTRAYLMGEDVLGVCRGQIVDYMSDQNTRRATFIG
jgi:CDP-glucose 4,6-dehydratase